MHRAGGRGGPGYWGAASVVRVNHTVLPALPSLAPQVPASASTRVRPRPPLRCIAAGCKPGGVVLDPFTGSGTTGLAAIQLGRQFTGIDLSAEFAQLAAERIARAVADKKAEAR